MTKRKTPSHEIINKPLTPKANEGEVEIKDPPEAAMNLTAHAAEVSGLRMLDAADDARRNPHKKA